MRVIVAGGGTGGHVIPALAIAQELRSRYRAQVLFVGTQRGIETRLVPAAGFELHIIQVGALNRVDFATRLKTLLDLPHAFIESAKLIREFRPDVMIGVGGYASGPAMLTASRNSRPPLRETKSTDCPRASIAGAPLRIQNSGATQIGRAHV